MRLFRFGDDFHGWLDEKLNEFYDLGIRQQPQPNRFRPKDQEVIVILDSVEQVQQESLS